MTEDQRQTFYELGRNALQERISGWLVSVAGTQEFDSQMAKFLEEAGEIRDAYLDEQGNEQLARELTDLTVVAIGMVGLLGYSHAELALEAVEGMENKYANMGIYQEEGLSFTEARARCKLEYDQQSQTTAQIVYTNGRCIQ